MKIDGIWDGILYMENLHHFVQGEKIRIVLLSIDPDLNVSAQVTEEKQTKGLKLKDFNEEITYQVVGKIDKQKENLYLTGIKNNEVADQNKRIQIKLRIYPDKQCMKGVYYMESDPDLQTIIELHKVEDEKKRK